MNRKTEIAIPELNLFPIQGNNIEPGFDGDCICSDGGLLLFSEPDFSEKTAEQKIR
jgi:hypothetical protein